MKRIILLIILTLSFINLFSQTKISGEIRPRAEFRDGYRTPREDDSEPAFFISQRSRLNLEYTGEKYAAFLAVQDVRLWGDEKYNIDNPSFALHEAWVKFNLAQNVSLKLGRQTIGYENNRIISAANWSQSSKKHDAVVFNFNCKGWNIDFTNAFNQASEKNFGTDYSNGQDNYKYLSMLWFSKSVKKASFTGFSLIDGYQYAVDTVYSRFTYGGVFKYHPNSLFFTTRLYGQGGRLVSGTGISSYLMNLEMGSAFEKSNITAGIEVSSGNDYKSNDGKSHIFETPYGAKHWMNGTMDYFKKSSDTKNTGLVDLYLKWSQKIF